MDKIVREACKIDLHIHSKFSKHKDEDKVSENTIEKLNVLIDKLKQNEVNVCSITDHDVFSYPLYKELKKYENTGELSKVLPGVEFSVLFEQEGLKGKTVHVIAIFDDCDEHKISLIDDIICNKGADDNLIPKYDCNYEFSESKFISLLRKIDLDVLLIAHQKASPKGRSYTKNDVMTLDERHDELLFTCYFDALEFKNRSNEMFNRSFIIEKELQDKIGFITGTDCHSWDDYPFMYKGDSKVSKTKNEDNLFTYAKCLPTFKGLTMCFTDYTRFSYENKFFSKCNIALEKLNISIGERIYDIPLSNGINVIIGDNSVGKSLMLYELLGDEYKDKLLKAKKEGYKKYVEKYQINFDRNIINSQVFQFDSQGEIRNKFEHRLFKDDKFLSSFFEGDVNTEVHNKILTDELKKLLKVIKNSDDYYKLYNDMTIIDFTLSYNGYSTFNVSPFYDKRDSKKAIYKSSFDWLELVETQLRARDQINLEETEWNKINEFLRYIDDLKKKYIESYNEEGIQDRIFSIFKNAMASFKKDLEVAGTEYQQEKSRVNDEINDAAKDIIKIFEYNLKNKKYEFKITSKDIKPNININNNFNFVSSCNIKKIDSDYFYNVYENVFKKGKVVNPSETYYDEINATVSKVPEGMTGIKHLEEKMMRQFSADLKSKYLINPVSRKFDDIHKELSDGMNQRNYFEIISGEVQKGGIYIVDQPEDGVAQKAINDFVLKNFKDMSRNRQVIMVTHNPQFIINLDVDNVIFIGKDEEEDTLYIQSGALEFASDDYSVLDIVSENIEGGIDALRKRWKRYGKSY